MGVAGKNFDEQHPAKQPNEIPADGCQQSASKGFHRSRLRDRGCRINGEEV